MSVKDNVHFPHHVDIDDFIIDFCDKRINGWKMQEKYKITGRQYRLLTDYLNKEIRVKPRSYKSPQRKYIYRDKYGSFVVRKRVDGVFKFYGAFRKLDDAIEMRDKLIECDWDENMI